MGDYRRLTRLVDWYPAAQHRRESSNVQELNTSVPRVSTRKSTHWCPSKPPTSCGFFLYSSASGFRQARVKSAPWQVAAAPAPQTTSVVTPLPVEVVNTAGSRSSHDSAKTIAALPTATLQAEQFPASPPQVSATHEPNLWVTSGIPKIKLMSAALCLSRIRKQLLISTDCLMELCWSFLS